MGGSEPGREPGGRRQALPGRSHVVPPKGPRPRAVRPAIHCPSPFNRLGGDGVAEQAAGALTLARRRSERSRTGTCCAEVVGPRVRSALLPPAPRVATSPREGGGGVPSAVREGPAVPLLNVAPPPDSWPSRGGAGGCCTTTTCRRPTARVPSWTGGWFSPRGDRWWRVWACPEHLYGLTGLREFGRRREL